MVFEDGKFYPMIHVLVHPDKQNEEKSLFDKFGPDLLMKKHPVLLEYLKYTGCTLSEIEKRLAAEEKTDKIDDRMEKLKIEQKELAEAFKYFET